MQMLNVIILTVPFLNVIMLSVIMLNAAMLVMPGDMMVSAIMLCTNMPSVFALGVVRLSFF
jgi:hypothetical protein